MRTIACNFHKNPHTANFLMTFHTAGGANLGGAVADDTAALASEAGQDDLLNLVPVEAPAWKPSSPQVALISKLVLEINALDTEKGEAAASYTARMDQAGAWTRENTTRWIGNMIKMSRELNAATPPAAEVADGRYAVEHEGVLKFYKVKNGGRPGFVFLDVQASDEWHAIRNVTRIREIAALIAQDAEAASLRYGQEIGECGDCGRTLTTEASRARGRGPICDAKH